MTNNKRTGSLGEKIAVDYLRRRGYDILELNYRFKRAEIDIIAMHEAVVIFVEVKARSSFLFGRPEEFVSSKKWKLIADAANHYLLANNLENEVRFDIIAVDLRDPNHPKTEHFKDAFFPGLS